MALHVTGCWQLLSHRSLHCCHAAGMLAELEEDEYREQRFDYEVLRINDLLAEGANGGTGGSGQQPDVLRLSGPASIGSRATTANEEALQTLQHGFSGPFSSRPDDVDRTDGNGNGAGSSGGAAGARDGGSVGGAAAGAGPGSFGLASPSVGSSKSPGPGPGAVAAALPTSPSIGNGWRAPVAGPGSRPSSRAGLASVTAAVSGLSLNQDSELDDHVAVLGRQLSDSMLEVPSTDAAGLLEEDSSLARVGSDDGHVAESARTTLDDEEHAHILNAGPEPSTVPRLNVYTTAHS